MYFILGIPCLYVLTKLSHLSYTVSTMSGSFNNHARRVRNANLPLPIRAVALRSCISKCSWVVCGAPYSRSLKHLGIMVGADLQKSANEKQLLAVLNKIEITRNQILALESGFERRRIRQKMRGRRTPKLAEIVALQEATEAIRRKENMIPSFLTHG